jgi:ATP-dependent protease HslVU (ClpYQ) peptidase subunit
LEVVDLTIVIGIRNNDEIMFGGDRCVSNGQKNMSAFPKIFKKKNMLFGVAGQLLLIQHLKYNFKIPTHSKGVSDEKYMNTIFINELRKCFENNRASQIEKNQEEMFSSIIVGYKNKLYLISTNFCVSEFNSSFIAIGSGKQYAIGALETDIERRGYVDEDSIRTAIEIAARYNFWCDNNVDIIKLSK